MFPRKFATFRSSKNTLSGAVVLFGKQELERIGDSNQKLDKVDMQRSSHVSNIDVLLVPFTQVDNFRLRPQGAPTTIELRAPQRSSAIGPFDLTPGDHLDPSRRSHRSASYTSIRCSRAKILSSSTLDWTCTLSATYDIRATRSTLHSPGLGYYLEGPNIAGNGTYIASHQERE